MFRERHFGHCVYQCVPARLQYGLQYMRGRQFVLRMRFLGVGQGTTEVNVDVGGVCLDPERTLSSASKQPL
jgi:hypothetical protein